MSLGNPVTKATGRPGTMKLSVALFFAGIFGALAAVFILLSFGTDYWLLASESCHHNSSGSAELGDVAVEVGVGRITSVYCALTVNGEPRLDVFNMTENLRHVEKMVLCHILTSLKK